MGRLFVRLFGRFDAGYEECTGCEARPLRGLDARKPQECLSYLLLHRQRMLPREVLAELIAPDMNTEQSRKGLRQVLWQVQSALGSTGAPPVSRVSPVENATASVDATAPADALTAAQDGSETGVLPHDRFLVVDAEWVYVNPRCNLWLDVAEIDAAFQGVIGQPGETLSREVAEKLRAAVAVYRGDLLEGWYHDWCLVERERLQSAYLALLDKLMAFSAGQAEYEAGLVYGQIILAHDRARERTHQRMMELHALAGDRTGALRQYRACVAALNEELGVAPSQRTRELYERIASGDEAGSGQTQPGPGHRPELRPHHLPLTRSRPLEDGNRSRTTPPKGEASGAAAHEPDDDALTASFSDLVRLQSQVNRRMAELGHLLNLESPTTPSEPND